MKWRRIENAATGDVLFESKTKAGLPLRIVPRPGMAYTSALLAVDYGSIDDKFVPPGKTKARAVPPGIAHFLEHKMFEKERGDLSMEFSARGAQANAMTSHRMTGYVFSCTSDLPQHLETLFEITCSPWFTPELVEKEQGIIDQEIRGYDDSPGWRSWRAMMEAMYFTHPARIDIAGTSKSIRKITSDLLHLCHGAFYVPQNMVFTLVGDVDPETVGAQAEALCERFYGSGQQPVAERVHFEEPEEIRKERTRLRMAVSMPRLVLGFKGPLDVVKPTEMTKLDAALTLFMDAVLSDAGPLYDELFADGLITDDFNFAATVEPGISYAYATGATPDPKALANRILDAVEEALDKPLDPELLLGARRRNVGDFIRSFDSPDSLTWTLAESHFQKWPLFGWPAALEKIGEKTIRRLAASTLSSAQAVMVEVQPKAS